ncbi:LUD domain-containing protein [Spiractinospora alimapuensis]|nr:LUD domain-containing protein [Spiractinospora alimapuensis]
MATRPRVRRAHALGDVVPLFVENVADYRATVRRVTRGDLADAIGEAVRGRGVERLLVPADAEPRWLERIDAATTIVADTGLDVAGLDTVDGVVTGCALGVAETGTIVQDAGPGQGRRSASLIPDYHLCVVGEEQVVASVPQAVAALDPRRPLTWISGPSATSDIELDRVEGVHGPRTLDVLVVGP